MPAFSISLLMQGFPALLSLCAFLLTAAVPAVTFVVTKTADTADGACDADCSLREAIAAANLVAGTDTIRFEGSLAGQTIALTLGELTLDSDLVLDGGTLAVSVSGNDASRVFTINAEVHAEITGLTVKNGRAGSGAGIYSEGSLYLTDCTIRNNIASNSGGGIANEGNLTITTSIIRDNTATFAGGGLENGRFNGDVATATLISSTVSSNDSSVDGGGLYNHTAGTLTLLGATISGNSTFDWGGGIYSNGALTLTYSTVSSNTAVFAEGGGIHAFGATLENSTITGNESGRQGGGIFGDDVTVANSLIAGNTLQGDASDATADCEDPSSIVSSAYTVTGAGTGCGLSGTGNVTINPTDVFSLILDPTLADNGGPTLTHALLDDPDNLALDLGGSCGPVDQRGFAAPTDGPDANTNAECDAGSIEGATPVTQPDVTITLVPQNAPVVVPTSGGPFTFVATLTNTTAQIQSVQAWSDATLPNGNMFGPLVGPASVTLGPNQSVSRTLVQSVPGNAPAGSYSYNGYVGTFPNASMDGDAFPVTKTAAQFDARSEAPSLSAWAVADAVTGEAVTARITWTLDGTLEAAPSTPVPAVPVLAAAYPNPFRSTTALRVELPESTQVHLTVHDVLGRQVATLVDEALGVGRHEIGFDGSTLPSGIYLVRMEAGSFGAAQRITLIH